MKIQDLFFYIIASVLIVSFFVLIINFTEAFILHTLPPLSFYRFLNYMLTERLFYCIYMLSGDSSYLFYIPKYANYTRIADESDIYKCYTMIYGGFQNVTSIEKHSDKTIVKYVEYNVSYLPVFLFIDIKTDYNITLGENYVRRFLKVTKLNQIIGEVLNAGWKIARSFFKIISGKWDEVKAEWEKTFKTFTASYVSCISRDADYGITITTFRGTKPFLAVSKNKTLYIVVPQAFGYFEKAERSIEMPIQR